MPVIKHFHTLRKIRGTKGKNAAYMCNHSECSWKSPSALMEGKKFKCNFCENEFIFTPQMKSVRFPHCADCTTGKIARTKRVGELNEDIMKDMGLVEKELDG